MATIVKVASGFSPDEVESSMNTIISNMESIGYMLSTTQPIQAMVGLVKINVKDFITTNQYLLIATFTDIPPVVIPPITP